jgi:hypothetical protein
MAIVDTPVAANDDDDSVNAITHSRRQQRDWYDPEPVGNGEYHLDAG